MTFFGIFSVFFLVISRHKFYQFPPKKNTKIEGHRNLFQKIWRDLKVSFGDVFFGIFRSVVWSCWSQLVRRPFEPLGSLDSWDFTDKSLKMFAFCCCRCLVIYWFNIFCSEIRWLQLVKFERSSPAARQLPYSAKFKPNEINRLNVNK